MLKKLYNNGFDSNYKLGQYNKLDAERAFDYLNQRRTSLWDIVNDEVLERGKFLKITEDRQVNFNINFGSEVTNYLTAITNHGIFVNFCNESTPIPEGKSGFPRRKANPDNYKFANMHQSDVAKFFASFVARQNEDTKLEIYSALFTTAENSYKQPGNYETLKPQVKFCVDLFISKAANRTAIQTASEQAIGMK